MARIPPRVARGQIIGVCAPGGPVDGERLRRGLERLGQVFRIRLAPSLTLPREPEVPAYLAASDATRAREFVELIADPDVRGIIVVRGGYGAMRILPALDPAPLIRDPKPIVGFSDATALLAWAHAAGVRGIHGPMVAQLAELPDGDVAYLVELLTVSRAPGARRWTLAAHGTGVHRGHAVPANLTMASVLAATPWQLPLAGAIALLEEVGEKAYEIDRYVTQLHLAGALAQTCAAVIGDLTRCGELAERPPQPDTGAALATLIERLRMPVAVGAPFGHGARNEAIPFGAASTLDLDAGTFSIDEPAVA